MRNKRMLKQSILSWFLQDSWFCLFLCLTVPTILAAPRPSAAQPANEIVCRGGGGEQPRYMPFSIFNSQPQVWIEFKSGSRSVGWDWGEIDSLQPGQCSRLDRVISGEEPKVILVPIQGNSINSQSNVTDIRQVGESLPHIANMANPDRFQSFFVYNDGRGNFIVTGIGSSK